MLTPQALEYTAVHATACMNRFRHFLHDLFDRFCKITDEFVHDLEMENLNRRHIKLPAFNHDDCEDFLLVEIENYRDIETGHTEDLP